MLPKPRLTFFVELPADQLAEVVQPAVLETLARRGAAISMALLDLGVERAAAIRAFEAAGIAVTAWVVLDEAQGYWLNSDNADCAAARWHAVRQWSSAHGLAVATVGLDIEPPHDDTVALVRTPALAAARMLRRSRSPEQVSAAQVAYAQLVDAIRASGRTVEAYHVPLLADERRAGTVALRRSLGLVDLAVDREVWMLYRSALPAPWGAGLVSGYGPGTRAIGVGITGGGMRSLQPTFARRELDATAAIDELRRAARFCDDLYVFSLEGCVRRGALAALCAADLRGQPRQAERLSTAWVRGARFALRAGLRVADRLL
ncbi:MAG: hypothetical protein FJ100_20330 [Deltaproteobacteria bacterium]|nr:hypothetical protein [Deltaproteobacteria bacterium]